MSPKSLVRLQKDEVVKYVTLSADSVSRHIQHGGTHPPVLRTANFHNDVAHYRRLGRFSVKVASVTMAAKLQISHKLHVIRRYSSHVVSMGRMWACDNWLYSQPCLPQATLFPVFLPMCQGHQPYPRLERNKPRPRPVTLGTRGARGFQKTLGREIKSPGV